MATPGLSGERRHQRGASAVTLCVCVGGVVRESQESGGQQEQEPPVTPTPQRVHAGWQPAQLSFAVQLAIHVDPQSQRLESVFSVLWGESQ